MAQAANRVLLPLIALFLPIVMRRADLLGAHRSGAVDNILVAIVLLVVAGLDSCALRSVFGRVSD